jgi:hypothetical protein
MEKENKSVEFLVLANGLKWPFYDNKKAFSVSQLTKFIKELEYKEVPEHILKKAAERGKVYHDAIQLFISEKKITEFKDSKIDKAEWTKTEKRIKETIDFIKEKKNFDSNKFLGYEKLHYIFYKGDLLASYVDLEFSDFLIELKTNSFRKDNFSSFLVFEIQLLIQYLCTGKTTYILWSTGEGIIFEKFQVTDYSLKTLDALIDLSKNSKDYSVEDKKKILEKLIEKSIFLK